jgi:hypothetical protein
MMTFLLEVKSWVYAATLMVVIVSIFLWHRRRKKKVPSGSRQARNHEKRKQPVTAAESVVDSLSRLQTSLGFRIDEDFEVRIRSILSTAKYYRQLGFVQSAHTLDEVAAKAVESLRSRCDQALKEVKIESLAFQHKERTIAAGFVLNPAAMPGPSPGTFLLEIAVGPAGSRPGGRTSRFFAVRLEKGRSVEFDAAETLLNLPDKPNSVTDEVGNLTVTAAHPWVCSIILGNRQLAQDNCPCPPFLEEYDKILRSL